MRVVDDPVIAGFVNDLGRAILRNAGPDPYVYRFRLIDDPTLNAFAVYGGYVYFHTGTLAAASHVDELAGVMGHEIAHVRLRHHQRMQERAQIPDLLAKITGIGAAIATGEPGALIAAEGINVALQLRFSREFEAEADQEGAKLMAHAGFDPDGITRFFERVLAIQRQDPVHVPPYLYSHPDVERRIAAIEIYAEHTTRAEVSHADLDAEFVAAQARLAEISAHGTRWIATPSAGEPARIDPLLEAAQRALEAETPDQARALLAQALALAPDDPRVHFAAGEQAFHLGEFEKAARHYRRTLALDPTRALVFFQLGRCYEALGEAQLAVYAYEQAERRAGAAGTLRQRAAREVEKLSFTVVEEAGFADGDRRARDADTPFGLSVEALPARAGRMAWWARLGPRFAGQPARWRTRWVGPDGTRLEQPVRAAGRDWVGSTLDLPRRASAGVWQVEALLDGDVMDRREIRVGSATGS